MKTITVTRRIGEWFDFEPTWFDDHEPESGLNPAFAEDCRKVFLQAHELLEAEESVQVKIRYDLPWCTLYHVGLYDGWPYWRPYPSFVREGPLGPETHSYYQIHSVRVAP